MSDNQEASGGEHLTAIVLTGNALQNFPPQVIEALGGLASASGINMQLQYGDPTPADAPTDTAFPQTALPQRTEVVVSPPAESESVQIPFAMVSVSAEVVEDLSGVLKKQALVTEAI